MANEPSDNDFIQYWSAYGCWVTRTIPLVDEIQEATADHGVKVDGWTLKDGGAGILTGGTNTFNITNGTASLDVAAGAAVNVDDDVTISKALTVNGSYGTTIASEGQANTVTLNEGLTVGDGYSGTLTFSAASKTITVEDTSTVNQDLTTDASPTFVTAKLTGLTDGKIPYHVADATGFADGPTKTDVDDAVSKKHSQNTDTGTTGATFTVNSGAGTTLVITGGANTFSIADGTASLDIAAAATLNIDKSLTVDGQATTITGAGQANTITLNESLTVGDGYSGTLTFSADSKTLTVENTSVVSQDLTTDANPQFATIELGHATDTTLARVSAGVVSIEGKNIYVAGGTDVAVADGGTGLSSGTSGGILGYTAAGTIASSVALTDSILVVGGGAGATPTPLADGLGATTEYLRGNAAGEPTWETLNQAAVAGLTTADSPNFASLVITDAGYIGLGAAKGRIQFDDEGTDYLSFVDCYVGIGTTTPASLTELQGGLTTTGSVLTLGTKETTVVANDVLGRINFYAPLETSGTDAILPGASIVAIATAAFDATHNSTALHFQTGNSETAVGQTRLYIGPTGGVCVGGTTDPGDDNLYVVGKVLVGTSAVTAHTMINFPYGGIDSAAGYIEFDADTGNAIYLSINNVAKLTVDKGGWVCANYGLHVGGTSNPGDNNLLVDGTLHVDGAATLASCICEGNLTIGGATVETGSTNNLSIANGTAPDAHVDNQIIVYSADTSDSTATLALFLEQAVEDIGTFTASHKIKVLINGTAYWIQLDAV